MSIMNGLLEALRLSASAYLARPRRQYPTSFGMMPNAQTKILVVSNAKPTVQGVRLRLVR